MGAFSKLNDKFRIRTGSSRWSGRWQGSCTDDGLAKLWEMGVSDRMWKVLICSLKVW